MIDKDLIIKLLQEQVQHQAATIKLLESRIAFLENNQKKDSTNSSKPPSSDIGKPHRTQSLRIKSGKKPGGQIGHIGETLSFSTTPNITKTYTIKHCECCKKNISDISASGYERRQVFDIPPIEMLVTEHQSEIKNCPHCHTVNRAVFPAEVSQPVQYGTNIQQLAVYFTQYQLLPYRRTSEMFKDLFGLSLSQSFLVNNNTRCAVKLEPFITQLKSTLLNQPVLHVDETGFYFEGQRNWLHTICTDKHTFYGSHIKRGSEAIYDMGVLPFYDGRLIHDFWKPYNEFGCTHGLCNVHHLRDLTFCHQIEQSSWAGDAKQLLLNLHEKVMIAKNDEGATRLSKRQQQYWNKKYDDLMKAGLQMHPITEKVKGKRGVVKKSKTQNMLHRFINYKEQILAFTKNFLVPFGNNLAEQAIRMMKVKQKVSGCFRSKQGAQDFATIRSYIATAKKQNIPIMEALAVAITGRPFQV
jgi:transposase